MRRTQRAFLLLALLACLHPSLAAGAGLTLDREERWLVIRGANISGGEIRINYLEAYCRAGSTDADWPTHMGAARWGQSGSVRELQLQFTD